MMVKMVKMTWTLMRSKHWQHTFSARLKIIVTTYNGVRSSFCKMELRKKYLKFQDRLDY